MKNKQIAIIVPILLIVCALSIVLIRESYSAADTATGETTKDVQKKKWYYVRRNMFSHYYVSHNTTESDNIKTASGTILIKNGNRASKNDGAAALAVYCAEQGAANNASARTKYSLANAAKKKIISNSAKDILNTAMKYSYPYITLTNLKTALKNSSYGLKDNLYTEYNFDNLTAQEAMTATQAAIWNAMKGKTNYYNYGGKLAKISSRQSSFKLFGTINWQKCGGYHTGSNLYATILTTEDEEWYSQSQCDANGPFYKNIFELKSDGNVKNRINTLVTWYADLYKTAASEEDLPNVTFKNAKFNTVGDTLTLTVTLDAEGKGYTATFKDQSGKTYSSTNEGNNYTITGLPLTTSSVTATVTVPSTKKNVYYYKGPGQDWIGVNSGDYSVDLAILNEGKGEITLYKVANNELNVDIKYSATKDGQNRCGASGCLANAEFILYADDKETVISEITTTTEGFTISGLADGTYYLYEEEPPYGYSRYEYKGENVDSDGFIKIVITNGNAASVLVNNESFKVCVKKIDSVTKRLIDGATFSLQDAEGSVYEVFTTSTQYERYCLAEGQLEAGYYYLVEDKAPEGYSMPDKVYKFSLGRFDPDNTVVDYEDKDVIEVETVKLSDKSDLVTIENKPGTVITKSDLATGDCVTGAKLTVKDENGTTVDDWVSTCEDGKDSHSVELKPGKYTLVEEIAPNGYATAESIEFTINENGTASTSLDMKDAPIEVCLQKISGDIKGLKGATFEIYDANGNLYDTFTSSTSPTCFKYMPIGRYTIKETKAPTGYKKLENDIEIEVKDTATTQTFEIQNEVEVPKTSLDNTKIITIIASIFMIFGIGAISYYEFKKQS